MSENKRLAAIDIGSNSIRCLVVEAGENGGYRILDDEKATVRLGEGLHLTKRISPAAWERAREALLRMGKIAEGLGVLAVEAVATSAVRRAENGAEFVAAIKAETGIDIRVISGEEEAELAVLSARHHFSMRSTPYALVDIGGGSAEIVLATGSMVEHMVSLGLGAVYLSEKFLTSDPPGKKEIEDLHKHIRKKLKKNLARNLRQPLQKIIGSGGSITTIARILMAQRGETYDSVNRYDVLHSEVVHLLAMLQRMPCKERKLVPGLSPERADIIVAGMVVMDEIMRFLGGNILRINECGIREGLVLQSLEKLGLFIRQPVKNWRESVENLARTCHVDLIHAEQTRQLASTIFDVVAPVSGFQERDRTLLEAAALLHDIGYFINYAKHHKHSYHLIRHANLFDISPREKELIANIARYHRKSLPGKNHINFNQLSPDDQDRVAKLGGILRLADGLDRRRAQEVKNLEGRLENGSLVLTLRGKENLDVEIYAGGIKGDLFEKAFGLDLVLCEPQAA